MVTLVDIKRFQRVYTLDTLVNMADGTIDQSKTTSNLAESKENAPTSDPESVLVLSTRTNAHPTDDKTSGERRNTKMEKDVSTNGSEDGVPSDTTVHASDIIRGCTVRAISATIVFGEEGGRNSKVWRVLCDDGSEVAVKWLNEDQVRKGFRVGVETCKQEMDRLRALRDFSFIVNPADIPVGFEDLTGQDVKSGTFVCTEWCNGGTLEDVKRPVEVDCVLKWWKQMCMGVSAIHENLHLLHNDLRPANLFLHDGDIRIGDFGLCSPHGDEEAYFEHSPISDFNRGNDIFEDAGSYKSNVFSIAMNVLYLLVEEKVKFYHRNLSSEIFNLYGPYTSCLPAPLRELLSQSLEKSSRDRPSMAECLHKLEEYC